MKERGKRMGVPRITLMEAYLIETIRNSGESDDAIIGKVTNKNITAWIALHDHFDFSILIDLQKEDKATFEKIIRCGYQVKFLTFNGLQNLLKLKFNKHPERDFHVTEKGVEALKMSEVEVNVLGQLVSTNWRVEVSATGEVNVSLVV